MLTAKVPLIRHIVNKRQSWFAMYFFTSLKLRRETDIPGKKKSVCVILCGAINLGFGGHGGNERRPAQSAKAPPRKAFTKIRRLFAARAFPP
jgi:hypothetical protein